MTDKVHSALRRYFGANPEGTTDVIVVLNVPQPDLSFLFTKSAPTAAHPAERGDALAKAEREISEILERTGGRALQRLPNAASIVARIGTRSLEALSASECVVEIVQNDALR